MLLFAFFGQIGAPIKQALLAHYYKAPQYLGSADGEVSLVTQVRLLFLFRAVWGRDTHSSTLFVEWHRAGGGWLRWAGSYKRWL